MPKQAKTSARRLKNGERQQQALNLRIAGASFDQIARQVGYASRGAARNAVLAILKRREQEPADELRKMEGERLDRLQLGLWNQAANGDREAIDRLLRLMKRRADLFGLDAPAKIEQTGKDGGPMEVVRRIVWDDGSGSDSEVHAAPGAESLPRPEEDTV